MLAGFGILNRDVDAIVAGDHEGGLRVDNSRLHGFGLNRSEVESAVGLKCTVIASSELHEKLELTPAFSLLDLCAIDKKVDASHQALEAGQHASSDVDRPLKVRFGARMTDPIVKGDVAESRVLRAREGGETEQDCKADDHEMTRVLSNVTREECDSLGLQSGKTSRAQTVLFTDKSQ